MILLLFLLLQAPEIPRGSLESARMMDFHISRVSARHNEQFVDAWQRYIVAFEAWGLLTQRSAGGVTANGVPVHHLELLQATGQLKKAALDLLHEVERVHERIDDLVDETRKAPPK